jgi:hypothetical protein
MTRPFVALSLLLPDCFVRRTRARDRGLLNRCGRPDLWRRLSAVHQRAAYDPSASDRTTEQSVKHRIEAFGDVERCAGLNTVAASTIDAPEVYERSTPLTANAIGAFHRFCGKGCGKPCAKLERARQMRASDRFAQLCGRILSIAAFNGLSRNQTHPLQPVLCNSPRRFALSTSLLTFAPGFDCRNQDVATHAKGGVTARTRLKYESIH